MNSGDFGQNLELIADRGQASLRGYYTGEFMQMSRARNEFPLSGDTPCLNLLRGSEPPGGVAFKAGDREAGRHDVAEDQIKGN